MIKNTKFSFRETVKHMARTIKNKISLSLGKRLNADTDQNVNIYNRGFVGTGINTCR